MPTQNEVNHARKIPNNLRRHWREYWTPEEAWAAKHGIDLALLLVLLISLVIFLVGCAETIQAPMSQADAWTWQAGGRAEQFLEEHPVVTLRPDRPVPEECVYMEMVAAGPGTGVRGEQHNVLKVAALMGATHVQWQDVETAHAYRCPPSEAKG